MTVIALPKILIERLTDEGAKAFVDALDKTSDESQKITLQIAEERFEKRIEQVRVEIRETKSEIIKWMFIFWVGQVGVFTAILFTLLKK